MENIVNPEIEENGNVNISDEVVSIIASLAASEVKGVAGMGNGNPVSGGLAELLGKKSLSRGVKVLMDGKRATLDLSIIAEYGTKIPDVAWKVQEKVKSEVETMTNLDVIAVNISVDGVNVPKLDGEPVKATEDEKAGETPVTEE
ncbi:MAG: Asp23/Gls24 family envelope stress response protein [Clostridia bacterium]|nr:Asp23/Gls24 family envelope stress response protein [Clostridia bacterium]